MPGRTRRLHLSAECLVSRWDLRVMGRWGKALRSSHLHLCSCPDTGPPATGSFPSCSGAVTKPQGHCSQSRTLLEVSADLSRLWCLLPDAREQEGSSQLTSTGCWPSPHPWRALSSMRSKWKRNGDTDFLLSTCLVLKGCLSSSLSSLRTESGVFILLFSCWSAEQHGSA